MHGSTNWFSVRPPSPAVSEISLGEAAMLLGEKKSCHMLALMRVTHCSVSMFIFLIDLG